MPEGGAHPSLNQKTYRSTYPSQNTGIETPRSANTIPARSVAVPRRTADTMPTGMPIRSHVIAAPRASATETGRRAKISSFTGTKLLYE
jgi:hypothetical protein